MTSQYVSHPVHTLLTAFLGWKALLLAIAWGTSIGITYDTSTSLLPDGLQQSTLVTRLTSWDGLYFIQLSQKGYQFEQVWAFGSGLPTVVSIWKKIGSLFLDQDWLPEAVLAIGVSHLSHFLSVLVLFKLGKLIWRDSRIALIAAILHIFSPAGIFLSAPYTESTFALLSFAGYYLFAQGCLTERPCIARDAWQLLAGIVFGVATLFRSNGILCGIPFAFEAVRELRYFVRNPQFSRFRRLVFLALGGACIGAASVIPQVVAYMKFCYGAPEVGLRPWCTRTVPSIYTFVQEEYWGSLGLFAYWHVNNLPMFILAAPMTFVLIKTGIDLLSESPASSAVTEEGRSSGGDQVVALVRCIATAQLILAMLAVTSYHVQIITRLASGYPVWYWWLARSLVRRPPAKVASVVTVFIVMYASIQVALFAFFLPPA